MTRKRRLGFHAKSRGRSLAQQRERLAGSAEQSMRPTGTFVHCNAALMDMLLHLSIELLGSRTARKSAQAATSWFDRTIIELSSTTIPLRTACLMLIDKSLSRIFDLTVRLPVE
jgi:hypothetical protein